MSIRQAAPLRRAFCAVALVIASLGTTPVSTEATTPIIRPEEAQVERLYRAVFGRAPDTAGFAYWFRLRSTTTTLHTIALEFVASPEFATVAGAPTSAEFIDLLYRNVLDRPPDPAGMAYWERRMAQGLDRADLVVAFAESAEFVASTGTGLDPLPPFRSSIEPVEVAMLGASWRPGCPVAPADLVAVDVSIVDFDGRATTGQVIVHRSAADSVVKIFERLYRHRYPIERMEPVAAFDGDDDASMAANNTSGFNCRPITGGTNWSRHAFGLALDVNPLQNPWVARTNVLPPTAVSFVDRNRHHPAMIRRNDVVVSAFADAGWRWGGDFTTLKDWQHFER